MVQIINSIIFNTNNHIKKAEIWLPKMLDDLFVIANDYIMCKKRSNSHVTVHASTDLIKIPVLKIYGAFITPVLVQ